MSFWFKDKAELIAIHM